MGHCTGPYNFDKFGTFYGIIFAKTWFKTVPPFVTKKWSGSQTTHNRCCLMDARQNSLTEILKNARCGMSSEMGMLLNQNRY